MTTPRQRTEQRDTSMTTPRRTETRSEQRGVPPLFAFGIISDVQYAQRGDGYSYRGTPRYYRGALEGLRRAVASWLSRDGLVADTPFFVLQLGDLLDGQNAPDGSERAMTLLLSELQHFSPHHVHHSLGNHELYNFSRAQLCERLSCFDKNGFYYDFSPHPRFRFINLDTYDVSIMGAEEGTEEHRQAMAYIARNPNRDTKSPNNLWGTDRRFVAFNGAIGEQQRAFLRDVLEDAMRQHQWVILFHHIPCHPRATQHEALLWDYEEYLELLHSFPNVLATLSGHTHEHCIHRDERGIVHYVLGSPLECPPRVDAFSTAFVYEDRVVIRGSGIHDSITIPCRPFPVPKEDEDADAQTGQATQSRKSNA